MNETTEETLAKRALRVAIIGAGASGIAAAIRLVEDGNDDVTIFEKASDVGGTWRDNVYPGLACDVPSHLYRYSFAPNPDWKTEYASGPDILAYLRNVSQKRGIVDLIRFDSEVLSARFEKQAWHIVSSRGDEGSFDIVIAAMGVLHKPVLPDIPGRDDFAGKAFHSSRWDRSLDLSGKRVGIIGAGSTAVQILPAIIDDVASVALFMRTPQWVVPVANRPFPEEKKARFRNEPQAMDALYDLLADRFNSRFAAALVGENPEGLAEITQACQDNLANNVHDSDLRRRLTPNYAVGCKRLVVSDRFYPALQRPNARLVDGRIAAIEAAGMRMSDGSLIELDVLVYATGFDPFNFFRPMTITGEDGLDLGTLWEHSSTALRSVAVPGFPNLFFLGGPNSPIGNFSFLMTAETQLDYIRGLIGLIRDGACRTLAPKPKVTAAWQAEIDAAMDRTVWVTGGCHSWYVDRSGKVASWPWTYERFRQELGTPRLDEFDLS
ncbi:NAD(P)/FAD-dependent oxidoreductase [Bosea sp. (in: a-proteobacteria)]|uniref:flavin-containing monooxygenase n=1 Tax=Bosea sp. (in: a-proteobacteria) TaxID=1871050 RepID=UPI003340F8F6